MPHRGKGYGVSEPLGLLGHEEHRETVLWNLDKSTYRQTLNSSVVMGTVKRTKSPTTMVATSLDWLPRGWSVLNQFCHFWVLLAKFSEKIDIRVTVSRSSCGSLGF